MPELVRKPADGHRVTNRGLGWDDRLAKSLHDDAERESG